MSALMSALFHFKFSAPEYWAKRTKILSLSNYIQSVPRVISVWNGSPESVRPPSDARKMMEAHVMQTLEVTPLLNCGKWMTGVCFAWRMGLCEAESSIQSHWLLWIGWLAIATQAWFVSSLSFMSCCNQNKLFLFFFALAALFFHAIGPTMEMSQVRTRWCYI